jgi:Putative auto-transporter adhesin, head GIN domain
MQHRAILSVTLAASLLGSVGCAGSGMRHGDDAEHETRDPDEEAPGSTTVNTVVGSGNVIVGADSVTLGGSVPSETITGNGRVRAEVRSVDSFSHVVNASALSIQVRPGDVGVSVEIDDNLLPYVEVAVSDDTLTVRTTRGFHFERAVSGPFVRITLPHLASATAASSGRLDVTAQDAGQAIRLHTDSSGNLTFSGQVARLEATSESTGRIRLAGTCDSLEITSLGHGGVDADQLSAASGSIHHEGNGNVTATISGSVDVSSRGSGDVTVGGGARPGAVMHEGSGRLSIQ